MNDRPLRDRMDPKNPAIAALIPAYNEEAVIGSVVAATLAQMTDVIVVDDGSTDATGRLARAAGADVLALAENRGKAGAVMAGFAAAVARGYGAVVMLDADGQHNPDEIPGVLGPVLAGEADLVIGSRFLEVRSEIPRYRVLGQKTLNLFTALGAGVSLTDTQSGFRALGPAALARLDFASTGYSLESDMIAHFADCDLRILEVPISCRYDVPNKHKKNPVLHGLEITSSMFHAILNRQRHTLRIVGVPLVLTGSMLGFVPALLLPAGSGAWTPTTVIAFGFVAVVGAAMVAGSRMPERTARADPPTGPARRTNLAISEWER
ncbi:MAG: glycosyltransferase family 2 protein [Methanospirillum sp.]